MKRPSILDRLRERGLVSRVLMDLLALDHEPKPRDSVRCPSTDAHRHGDRCPSFVVGRNGEGGACMACGLAGGLLDLARALKGLPDRAAAARYLEEHYLGNGAPPREGPKGADPKRPAPRVTRTTRYAIRDLDGRHVATHVRRDLDDGSKGFHWELPDGSTGLGGLPVAALPLYGTELLKDAGPSAPVVLVEGEKAADALRALGFLALATVTGAAGTPSREVLAALAGRTVYLWPDADPDGAGQAHMERIAAILHGLGAKVSVVEWKDAPTKGDAADLVEAGGTREAVEALLDAAKPWAPPAQEPEPEPAEESDEEGDGPQRTHADRLVALVRESGAELWHTADGECYATIRAEEHDEHLRIRGRDFRQWIAHAAAKATRKAPSRNAIDDALATLGGEAVYAGKERAIHVRLAAHEDEVMLDLGDRERRVVEIGADGWKVIVDERLPVRFRRPPGALALPVPERGGSIDLLRPLLNVEEADFDLIVAWLLGAMNPIGPYPALAASGEHGTGKSTLCNLLVELVDPKDVPLRRPPKDERDLFIAASNGHVVGFNNVSRLAPDLSDALSALATEGGFACRKLYENDEEARFRGRRPLLLNGIEDFVTRGDLGDRCIRVVLPLVKRRRAEAEILREFERLRPALLGALLDGVSCALRRRHEVKLDELPRMADFALWIEAAAPGIGRKPGALVGRYREAVEGAASSRIEDDVIASAVVRFMHGRPDWTGTAGDLLAHLGKVARLLDGNGAPTKAARPKDWPETPRKLSGDLTRLAPDLRAVGIEVERLARSGNARPWRLSARKGTQPSQPSQPSQAAQDAGSAGDGASDGAADRHPDRHAESADAKRGDDGRDGSDGANPLLRKPEWVDGEEP